MGVKTKNGSGTGVWYYVFTIGTNIRLCGLKLSVFILGGGSSTWGTWDHKGIWGRNWEAREEGTTMITTTILHPHPHATRNKTRREEIELTLYTQGHKSNSAYAMDLFLGFQL